MATSSKCKWCVKEIKMKNHIMINASLCLLNDDSKDVVFTWFLFIRWAIIKTDIKKKWQGRRGINRLEIQTWPYLTRRMGSYDCPIFNVEVKSKWKTCWLLCFKGLTTRKLKRKEMCNSVVWFCNLWMPYIIVCLCNFWMPCRVVNFSTFWTF
jgi:hypothetical protein